MREKKTAVWDNLFNTGTRKGAITQRQHIELMATPNWKVVKDNAPHKAHGPIWLIPKSALRYKPTERLIALAEPKEILAQALERRAIDEDEVTATLENAARNSKPTQRLADLSTPPLHVLKDNLRLFAQMRGPEFKKRMKSVISRRMSMYRDSARSRSSTESGRKAVSEKSSEASTKAPKKVLKTEADWQAFNEWALLCAAPKKLPEPPPSPPRKKGDVDFERLGVLSAPPERYLMRTPEPTHEVPRSALEYQASDRVKELSRHREYARQPRYKPGGVKRSALRGKIDNVERLLEISKPRERKSAADPDEKEDAFKIPKNVLNARCSPRLKELAVPRGKK